MMTGTQKTTILEMRAEGITYKTIAEQMGMSLGSMKMFVSRHNRTDDRRCEQCGKLLPKGVLCAAKGILEKVPLQRQLADRGQHLFLLLLQVFLLPFRLDRLLLQILKHHAGFLQKRRPPYADQIRIDIVFLGYPTEFLLPLENLQYDLGLEFRCVMLVRSCAEIICTECAG